MSGLIELAQSADLRTEVSDDLDHYYCCDPQRSMCGFELTGEFVDPESEGDMCVVCEDLYDEPCDDPNCPDRAT